GSHRRETRWTSKSLGTCGRPWTQSQCRCRTCAPTRGHCEGETTLQLLPAWRQVGQQGRTYYGQLRFGLVPGARRRVRRARNRTFAGNGAPTLLRVSRRDRGCE